MSKIYCNTTNQETSVVTQLYIIYINCIREFVKSFVKDENMKSETTSFPEIYHF